MVVGLAGDAVFLFFVGAVFHPVVGFAACSAGVTFRDAFPCDVVPVVAFHAVDWFLLGLGCLDMSLTDG